MADVRVAELYRRFGPAIYSRCRRLLRDDVAAEDAALLAHMFETARKIAEQLGVATQGYRTVFNVNADAGQTVFHLHLHVIGGRKLSWP